MLWRIFQGMVMFAILSANIHFQWTSNGYLAGAWAFMGAYALTVFPFQIYDWWAYRHVRREEYAAKKAAGIPHGWRRHLPWNSRAASRDIVRPPVRILDKPIISDGSGRRFRGQRRTDRRP